MNDIHRKEAERAGNAVARRSFIKTALFGTAGLAARKADAQSKGLSPDQIKTVTQLIEDLKATIPKAQDSCPTLSRLQVQLRERDMREDFANIHPILVGNHVMFSKKWLNYINANANSLTPQEFTQWRDNADLAFERCEDLIGQTPTYGKKVFVSLVPPSGRPAHAHSHTNVICYGEPTVNKSFAQIKKHGCDFLILHELAYLFSSRRLWEAEPESVATLLVSYVLEKTKLCYDAANAGVLYRQREFDLAQERIKNQDKVVISRMPGTVYDYYLLGLLDQVGWETYKDGQLTYEAGWGTYEKVFRSYQDDSYIPKRTYKTDLLPSSPYQEPVGRYVLTATNKKAIVRYFLDRIEDFSGKPDVLKSLPDKGRFLDWCFNPQVVRDNTGQR